MNFSQQIQSSLLVILCYTILFSIENRKDNDHCSIIINDDLIYASEGRVGKLTFSLKNSSAKCLIKIDSSTEFKASLQFRISAIDYIEIVHLQKRKKGHNKYFVLNFHDLAFARNDFEDCMPKCGAFLYDNDIESF